MDLRSTLGTDPLVRSRPRVLRLPEVADWSGLVQAVRAALLHDEQSRRQLVCMALAAIVLGGILVADWLVWPGRNLDILYAVPVLIAALYVSPRGVAIVALAAVAADAGGAVIARDPMVAWAVTVPSLAVVVAFGVIVAYQRQKAAVHAAEADRTRAELQRFLGMVAHDLAGPVTALQTYSEVLQQGGLDSARSAQLGSGIGEVVVRISRFVEDLRDAGRIGRGDFAIRPEPTELVAIARKVVEQQRRTAERPDIILEAPDAILGTWDGGRVAQVFGNLLANAVKYSQGKPVQVTLALVGAEVVGRITDRGPGIPPEESARIFDAFVRLDVTRPGTGLGLYIAREIVRAHGGRLWLESQPGVGSTFSFALPGGSSGSLAED
jgi:signal transduction histidine kinase